MYASPKPDLLNCNIYFTIWQDYGLKVSQYNVLDLALYVSKLS